MPMLEPPEVDPARQERERRLDGIDHDWNEARQRDDGWEGQRIIRNEIRFTRHDLADWVQAVIGWQHDLMSESGEIGRLRRRRRAIRSLWKITASMVFVGMMTLFGNLLYHIITATPALPK